jgi:hypothetical protein
MATYKVLGGPTAISTTLLAGTAVVAAPGFGLTAAVSSIVVANTSTAPQTFRIGVGVGVSLTTLSAATAIAWDVPIDPNSTIALSLGITLSSGDTIYASASASSITMTAFGATI